MCLKRTEEVVALGAFLVSGWGSASWADGTNGLREELALDNALALGALEALGLKKITRQQQRKTPRISAQNYKK